MSEHAIQNAANWLESIRDMMARKGAAEEADDQSALEKVDEEIQESPLCVEIRDGWRAVGGESEPGEYRILLTTGGPALRIIGELSASNEPESAALQWQDWGTPWTDYEAPDGSTDDALLSTFAQQFYFGE